MLTVRCPAREILPLGQIRQGKQQVHAATYTICCRCRYHTFSVAAGTSLVCAPQTPVPPPMFPAPSPLPVLCSTRAKPTPSTALYRHCSDRNTQQLPFRPPAAIGSSVCETKYTNRLARYTHNGRRDSRPDSRRCRRPDCKRCQFPMS